jgi:tetratricopeptide (TPR) repeat protein
MTSRLFSGRALRGVGVALTVALGAPVALHVLAAPAHAEDEAKPGTVRPEVGKPLQAAKAALDGKKFAEALSRLNEADAVANKTAFEVQLIEQMRLIAGVGSDQAGVAAKAFDALGSGGSLQPAQKLQFMMAISGAYFRAKEYGNSANWAARYFQAGGSDLNMRVTLAQAYYLNNDFGNATKYTNEAIDAYYRAEQTPNEQLFQLLTSCALKQNDKKAYVAALEKLVAAYPKQDYWLDLLHQVSAKGGFPDRLSLDLYRLQFAVGGLTNASQYMEFAELAIQAGLPAEAKAIVDKGYEAKILGQGQEADRHGRLRDMAKRSVEADQPTLASAESEASKGASGNPLVSAGMNFYGYGQYDKAAALITQGLAKGDVKFPDDARLHLGLVYLAAGKKAQAVEAFKSIKSGDAVNDLARLWLIKTTGRAAS